MKTTLSSILACSCLFLASAGIAAQSPTEKPQKIALCELLKDPKAWDHKLVEVTGFASHGFEDSGFSDPTCPLEIQEFWLEYGGTKLTRTKSTVQEVPLSQTLKIEGITTSLIDDAVFQRFDDFLHRDGTVMVKATVIARIFAGRLEGELTGPHAWRGFGHMGCCSLFVVQQVLTVDDQRLPYLDYSNSYEQQDAPCVHFLTDPR
jgi:hypothetical protein